MSNTGSPLLIPTKNLPTPKATAIDGQIFTRSFSGRFRNLRIVGAGFRALLVFGTSWIIWNGHQAILWDLDTRQFHVFGTTFWPQDFMLLAWALIIAAFSLFTVTVLLGRVYCGFTCPQTVWTDLMIAVERFFQGDRNARMRLGADLPVRRAGGLGPVEVPDLGPLRHDHGGGLARGAMGHGFLRLRDTAPDGRAIQTNCAT